MLGVSTDGRDNINDENNVNGEFNTGSGVKTFGTVNSDSVVKTL